MWKYLKYSKSSLIGYLIVSIIEGVIGAILPLISAKIILNITDGVINQLILSALCVFIIELILYFIFYIKGYFYNKVYQKTLVNLQIEVAEKHLN